MLEKRLRLATGEGGGPALLFTSPLPLALGNTYPAEDMRERERERSYDVVSANKRLIGRRCHATMCKASTTDIQLEKQQCNPCSTLTACFGYFGQRYQTLRIALSQSVISAEEVSDGGG